MDVESALPILPKEVAAKNRKHGRVLEKERTALAEEKNQDFSFRVFCTLKAPQVSLIEGCIVNAILGK